MTWTCSLARDGVVVASDVPCHEFSVAEVLAPLVVGWLGGPVSIVQAVVATRPSTEEPTLFDSLEDVA